MTTTDETPANGQTAPAAPAAPEAPAATDYFGRALAALTASSEEPEEEVGSPPAAPVDRGHHVEPTPVATEGDPEPTPPPAETQPEPAPEPQADHTARSAELDDRHRELDRDRAAFDAERQALGPNLAALKRAREATGADALVALRELGIDYNEITRRALAKPGEPPPPGPSVDLTPVNTKIEALEAQLNNYKQEQLRTKVATGAREAVDAIEDGARFELLKQVPAYDQKVVDYITQEWQARGELRDRNGHAVGALTFLEGADKLEETLYREATRFSQSPKVRAAYTPPEQPAPEPAPEAAPPATSPAQPPPAIMPAAATLTTTHASTAARPDNSASPEACRARALAVLQLASRDE